MAISSTLDIAARALVAQQAGLAVVGNNIANANTPGYTRQVAVLEQDQTLDLGAGVRSGDGVRLVSVEQVVDPLLERRRTAAQTAQGQHSARGDQLDALVAATNDLQDGGLGSAISSFFDAADGLALRPATLADRQTLLVRANQLASVFQQRSQGIAGVQRSADDKIGELVATVNADLDTIASTNAGIAAAEGLGQHANDLLDQRGTALNELASILGVNTVVDPNGAVRVAGDSGIVLVENGVVVNRLSVQNGAAGLDGRFLHDVTFTNVGNGVALSLPDSLQRGALAGLLEVRDTDTVTASGNLDTLAAGLRDAVNGVQTAGIDLGGAATTTTPLFGGSGIAGAAKNLTVAITDPTKLAAALSTELPSSGNGNARALAALRTTPLAALNSVTATDYVAGENGRIGESSKSAQRAVDGANAVVQQLEVLHASVSGVNLNEELTNLLRYQHAFQAASQVISVVNTTLDALLNIL